MLVRSFVGVRIKYVNSLNIASLFVVTNRPITSISASDGATVIVGDIGCVSNHGK